MSAQVKFCEFVKSERGCICKVCGAEFGYKGGCSRLVNPCAQHRHNGPATGEIRLVHCAPCAGNVRLKYAVHICQECNAEFLIPVGQPVK